MALALEQWVGRPGGRRPARGHDARRPPGGSGHPPPTRPAMTVATTTTREAPARPVPEVAAGPSLRAELDELARERRRDLCRRCGGDPDRPCPPCARQRARVVELGDGPRPAVIGALVGLPGWRVEQILEQQRDAERADHDERAANADLLRAELGDLVDVILAGPHPPPGEGWQFDEPRLWRLWVALSLDLVGWHLKAVNSVLNGTHIPNAPLRARVAQVRAAAAAAGDPLSSETLAARAGLSDGTHLERLIGARPASLTTKKTRRYGGRLMPAISIDHAARIADAAGIAHFEIPGL